MVEEFNPYLNKSGSFTAEYIRVNETIYIGDKNQLWVVSEGDEDGHERLAVKLKKRAKMLRFREYKSEKVDAGIVDVNLESVPPNIVFYLFSKTLDIPIESARQSAKERTVEIAKKNFPTFKVSCR